MNACIRRVLLVSVAMFATLCAGACGRETTPAAGTAPATVRVAAAASLRYVLDEVIAEFTRGKPEIRVEASFGATGTLATQLRSGAAIDVFLAADIETVEELKADGLASADGVFRYATGRLVVWQRNPVRYVPGEMALGGLAADATKKIAVASPRHAPYGRAAVSAMKVAGVYGAVSAKIVEAENVAQAAQFAESGAADVGLIALSLALSPPMQGKGEHFVVPANAHAPIEHGGIVTAQCANPAAAAALRDFLLSTRGAEIMSRFGYEQVKP